MADIRNDQYLHRPGAGRGAVTPTDPMEARLYDDDGNPVNPATEETLDNILDAVGAPGDSAQTDPAQSASQIALLKGLLSVILSIKGTDGIKKIVDAVTVSGLSELAKETTLGAVKSAVDSIAGEDFATEETLAATKGVLDTISSGVAKETTLGDVKTAVAALAALISDGRLKTEAALSGSTVEIDGKTYQVTNGYVLRGLSTDKPDAADAHAAIPNCVYWSVDTGDIEVTDGNQWMEV